VFPQLVLTYKNGMSKAYIGDNFLARSNQQLNLPDYTPRVATGNRYWSSARKTTDRLGAVFDEIITFNKKVSQCEVGMLYFGDY
jgi:hypothetical protein